MTNKDLANLIFKDLKLTHDDCLMKYPKRNLPDSAVVTRYAPSPTGFVHMGNIYAAFIERKMARQSGGIFYLRIEDTDQKRYVKDGIQRIIKDMKNFNIEFDECPLDEKEEIGNYGPYIQSQRKEIYHAFVKYFIENGWAYPCFCTEDDLNTMREHQKEIKDRLGYYGKYAKCRNLSIDEAYKRIESGEPYVIRFKSHGDYNNKIIVNDLVKGKIEFPENDKDEFEYIKSVLEKNGFIASLKSSNDIYQFFSSTSKESSSGDIHIHLVIKNTERYLDFLILKHYLQNNKLEAKKYSDFKCKLVSSGVRDRKKYKKEKSEYVSKLLMRAKEYCNQIYLFKINDF